MNPESQTSDQILEVNFYVMSLNKDEIAQKERGD